MYAPVQCNTTLLKAVQATPQLSLLYSVIQASGLAMSLNMTDNVTVLAPENNAFNGTNGLLGLLAANNLNLTSVTAPQVHHPNLLPKLCCRLCSL